jgi:hypothetical protein
MTDIKTSAASASTSNDRMDGELFVGPTVGVNYGVNERTNGVRGYIATPHLNYSM